MRAAGAVLTVVALAILPHAWCWAPANLNRRMLLTSSSSGTLQLSGAAGLCATGGYTTCLKFATFAVYGSTLVVNLTGPGCPLQTAGLNISANGSSALGVGAGMVITLVSQADSLLFSDSFQGGSNVCDATYTVTSGTLLGVSAAGSPSITTNTTSGSSTKSSCFPGNSLVQTPAGPRTMQQLSIGDKVLVAGPHQAAHYQDVFMFSHQDGNAVSRFVHVHTAAGSHMSLTPGHYIWAQASGATAKLVRAADLKVGHEVFIVQAAGAAAAPSRITALKSEQGLGLYNPHTASGSIVVDGVAASTFTDVLPASVAAHTAVTLPARLLYTLLPSQLLQEAANSMLLSAYSRLPSYLMLANSA